MGAFSPEPPSKNPLRQPKLYKTKHSDVDIKSDESIEFELGVDRPRKVIYVVAGLALLFFALFRGASAYAVEARQLRGAPSLKAETPKSYLDKQLAPEGSCDAKIWCGAEPFTKPASLCGAAPFLTAANAPALFDSCKTHRCDFSADSCTTYSEFFCYNKINVFLRRRSQAGSRRRLGNDVDSPRLVAVVWTVLGAA